MDPDAFGKVLAAARAFVAIYERPEESDAVFASRITQIKGRDDRMLD